MSKSVPWNPGVPRSENKGFARIIHYDTETMKNRLTREHIPEFKSSISKQI
jgi:hypothetical protein